MKKFLMLLTLVILTLVSCNDEPETKVTGFNFNEVIASDNEFVKILSGVDSVKFCEAQGAFDKPFKITDSEYEVIWIMTVFQVDTLVYTFTHDTLSNDPIISKYNDIWLGDLYSPINTNVDLKGAIDSLKSSEIDAPESPLFVLRRPITPPPFPENKLYIFGSSKTGVIAVDSETGKVKLI